MSIYCRYTVVYLGKLFFIIFLSFVVKNVWEIDWEGSNDESGKDVVVIIDDDDDSNETLRVFIGSDEDPVSGRSVAVVVVLKGT